MSCFNPVLNPKDRLVGLANVFFVGGRAKAQISWFMKGRQKTGKTPANIEKIGKISQRKA
jgi:hypothetical protein